MPRYFFAIEGHPPTDEYDELPDDAAALRIARIVEFELGRGEPVPAVEVFNERGERVRAH
jgi:hypothetical protein